MDLEKAIGKHAEWKMKFRNAISKHEAMDAATIAKDNCCELGEWLHGEGKIKYGHLASLGICLQQHATFHSEAGKVASVINAGRYAEAETMLGGGTTYSVASSNVAVAIVHLIKEAIL